MTTAEQAAITERFMRTAAAVPVLYQLADEWLDCLAMIEDPDAEPDAILAELDRLAGDIKRKAHGLAAVRQGLLNLAENQRAEAARQTERARRNEAAAERLRDYALRQMQRMELPRIETGSFTLAIKQNPPSVEILDAGAVPAEYQRTKVTIDVDKRAILDHFKKSGEIPPGVDVLRSTRLDFS